MNDEKLGDNGMASLEFSYITKSTRFLIANLYHENVTTHKSYYCLSIHTSHSLTKNLENTPHDLEIESTMLSQVILFHPCSEFLATFYAAITHLLVHTTVNEIPLNLVDRIALLGEK